MIRISAHDWRCIAGYGHAPEHIALYCEALKVLISGDMMLPRISTNVSVHEMEPEADSLALFLASMTASGPAGPDTPGAALARQAFPPGCTRASRAIAQHHRDRLAEVLSAARERALSAHDILTILFSGRWTCTIRLRDGRSGGAPACAVACGEGEAGRGCGGGVAVSVPGADSSRGTQSARKYAENAEKTSRK